MDMTQTLAELKTAVYENRDALNERLKKLEEKSASPASIDPLLQEKINKSADAIVQLNEVKQRLDAVQTAMQRPGAEGNPAQSTLVEGKSALLKLYRKGQDQLTDIEKKALTDQTAEAGGMFIKPELLGDFNRYMVELSPMRQLATVVTTTSDSVEMIDEGGLFEAAWVGEVDARPETGTAAFAKRTIYVHEIYAQPPVSQKFLDDSGFNVESYVNEKIAEAFAVKESTAFMSGTGTGQPKGIRTAGNGVTALTSTVSGGIGAADLIALLYDLKQRDIAQAAWLMNPAATRAILTMRDAGATGQFLWQPSFQAGQPAQLLGKPVYMSDDMETVAAGNEAVAVGNFKRGYMVVDRIGVRILRDPYTGKPFVRFYGTKRVGGDVTAADAIRLLTIAV